MPIASASSPQVDEGSARFVRNSDEVTTGRPLRLPWGYLMEFLKDGRTPIRALSDEAIRRYLPFLYGPGTIVELGAPSDYYRAFAPAEQEYHVTDNSGHARHKVDMTRMPFANDSVDAFISVFAMEHVREYRKAFAEVKRTLKRRGRFLLLMPFLYYYHAAPEDYVRLTRPALLAELDGFRFLAVENLGNRALCVAEMYHEKTDMGHSSSWLRRAVLRALTCIFLISFLWKGRNDEAYASAILVLCEKV